jgi:hypothetical protein
MDRRRRPELGAGELVPMGRAGVGRPTSRPMSGPVAGPEKENVISTAALWALILGGVGVAVTSMVLVYLMAKRMVASSAPVFPVPAPPPMPLDFQAQLAHAAPALPPKTQMIDTRTYALRQASPTRIATAYMNQTTLVTLRAVQPPGASIVVANSLAVANEVDTVYPTGSVIVLPVGGAPQEILLSPGDALFAKGSVDDALVSVSQTEA